MAKCNTCNGSGRCSICKGTGQIKAKPPHGVGHQCPSCAKPGNGVCRVCLGSGQEPRVTPNINKLHHLKKQIPRILKKELDKIELITDQLGKTIDNKIKLLVASLNANKFITTSSCSGHIKNNSAPYVDISSKETLKFESSRKVTKIINMMMKNPHNLDYIDKYEIECRKPREANLLEAARLLDLLTEFYNKRSTSSDKRLIIDSIGGGLGGYRLHPQGDFLLSIKKEHEKVIWLKATQFEMNAFADFLISKLK